MGDGRQPRNPSTPTQEVQSVAQRYLPARLPALAVIVSLLTPVLPAAAEPAAAALSGVIRSAADQAPLSHARLLVADRENGEVTRSEWTGADGNFSIAGLDPGRYDLAVDFRADAVTIVECWEGLRDL